MDKQAKGNCILPPPILGKINKLCLFVALLLVAAACDDKYDDTALWDKVNDHEERIAALEKWQEQTNQSIAGIQELLNTTDMITAVTTLTEGGDTLGYTISFRHGDPISIYNGAKGEPGDDGQTPQIGLTQKDDGNWYWTLNGELMTDADGNPIRANGEDGKDGEDGQDGADGEDGADGSTGPAGRPGADGKPAPTPQILLGSSVTSGTIKTDNGTTIADAWYLSVDNGATWYRVSGKDGTNGDGWLAKAPEKEGNYYLFTLTSGGSFKVAAYQAFRILTQAEKDGTESFTNATLTITGATTLYLSIDNDIDYTGIVAQISSVDAVLTRADVSDWTVKEGSEKNTLIVTPGIQPCALLDVSLLLKDGGKLTASRLLYDPGYTDDGNGNYTVTSAEGLKNLAKLVNEEGKTDIDITLSGDINLTDMEWTPIGAGYTNRYTGTFDGGGHTITGLTIESGDYYLGLFGYIGSGGTVQYLTLDKVQIKSESRVGENGGVAGENLGSIIACSVSGDISSPDTGAGGVVGRNAGILTACCFTGSVTGENEVGGVVGQNYQGSLTNCHSSASVTGESEVGGVVGYNQGTLTGCYAMGNVTGESEVGGVAGENRSFGTATACYHAMGSVSGTSKVGGVVGWNFSSTVTACYWDNNQGQGIGDGTGETTKVTDDWAEAVKKMNEALTNAGLKLQYELTGGNSQPPTLKE